MTYDSDYINERRFEREMSKFKHVFVTVQGVDEKACDTALQVELAKFTDDPDEWTVGQSNYSRREVVTGVDGETKIVVWELEATLARKVGYLPWSGIQ